MRVKLLVDSWRRPEKDEDGNRILTRYRKGDVIDVTNSEAKALCKERPLTGPIAEEEKQTEASADEKRSAEEANDAEQARRAQGQQTAQAQAKK